MALLLEFSVFQGLLQLLQTYAMAFFFFHSQYALCYLRPSKSLSQQPPSVHCQSLTFSQQCLDPIIFFWLPPRSYRSESLRNVSKQDRVCGNQNNRWRTFGKDWQLEMYINIHAPAHWTVSTEAVASPDRQSALAVRTSCGNAAFVQWGSKASMRWYKSPESCDTHHWKKG